MHGQHNCFLNVIIQSLWHLPAFRTALLNLPIAPSDNTALPKDIAVAQALHNVFAAFSQSPPEAQMAAAQRDAEVHSASAGSPLAQQLQQQERVKSSSSAAASADAVQQSISPDELREAMSQLDKGQTPINFDLSEMHDAAEVPTLLTAHALLSLPLARAGYFQMVKHRAYLHGKWTAAAKRQHTTQRQWVGSDSSQMLYHHKHCLLFLLYIIACPGLCHTKVHDYSMSRLV